MLQPCVSRAAPRVCGGPNFLHPQTVLPLRAVTASHSRLAYRRCLHGEVSAAPEQRIPLRKQLKDAAKAKKLAGPEKLQRSTGNRKLEEWELTVGIEIHAQLNTEHKLFSSAKTSINAPPNTHAALFDLAFPGSQPRLQKATLIPALRAAFALKCEVQKLSRFDRKHYFYQDQPAGYQITQYYEPFAKNGSLQLDLHDGIDPSDGKSVTIGIKQIQMEQDTAKSQEQDESVHLLDFNRVGHPLIEIITLPHVHSPATAAACVRKIQGLLLSVDAVTTGMEMGGLRADVNVSVRRRDGDSGDHSYHGVTGLGQRTEIKNLSSIKAVEEAIIAERDRQIRVLEEGGTVEGETRRWSIGFTETKRLRGKEGEVDYRYMPDPDIGPVIIGDDVLDHIRTTMPPTPDKLIEMLVQNPAYGLSAADATTLIDLDDGARLDYYQDVVEHLQTLQAAEPPDSPPQQPLGKLAGNWVLHELGRLLASSEVPFDAARIPAAELARILDHQLRNRITGRTARSVLDALFDGAEERPSATAIIEQENLFRRPLSRAEYVALARKAMAANEGMVRQVREEGRAAGKVMWFVGQMMRMGEKGRVEGKKAEEVLREELFRE